MSNIILALNTAFFLVLFCFVVVVVVVLGGEPGIKYCNVQGYLLLYVYNIYGLQPPLT